MPLFVNQTEPVPTLMASWFASGLLLLALLAGSLGCEEATLKPESATLTASVSPWGGTAFTDDVLTGGGELRHPRNVALASVSWSWSWKLDGADTGTTTQTVAAASTVKHQLWEVTVRADYGSGTAGPETAEIRIINSVPVITVANTTEWDTKVPAIEPRQEFRFRGRPYLGDTLSVVSPWTDVDNDVVTLSYEWTVIIPGVGSRPVVIDPTTDTLDTSVPVLVDLPPPEGVTLRAFALNDQIRVRITPEDDEERGRAVSTSAVKLKRPGSATAPNPTPANAGSGAAAGAARGRAVAVRSARSSALVPLPPPPIPVAISVGELNVRSIAADGSLEWSPIPIPIPISVSELNVCSISADGSLDCSGVEDFGLTQPPTGPFFQVAVRPDYGCAIRADDQTIACWGAPLSDLGQLAAPEGPFSQIDLGVDAACGLRAGGEIACWGDDSLGQSSPPEGQFIYLDVSDSYGCAMDAEGVVTCWGALE